MQSIITFSNIYNNVYSTSLSADYPFIPMYNINLTHFTNILHTYLWAKYTFSQFHIVSNRLTTFFDQDIIKLLVIVLTLQSTSFPNLCNLISTTDKSYNFVLDVNGHNNVY